MKYIGIADAKIGKLYSLNKGALKRYSNIYRLNHLNIASDERDILLNSSSSYILPIKLIELVDEQRYELHCMTVVGLIYLAWSMPTVIIHQHHKDKRLIEL